MATFEDICKANETIRTTDIKGKAYAEVNERIKAFRSLYPEGTLHTEMISNIDGVCIFRASVYANGDATVNSLLGTGHAYEKENSTFINKTSYIENCETSAVGRALAMCGIGIDTSVASAEEVGNAIANQNKEVDPVYLPTDDKVVTDAQWTKLNEEMKRTGATEKYICETFNVQTLKDMSQFQVITALNKFKNTPSKGKK